jgi:hypothetical protein
MGQSVIQRAFVGGELAPALYARADQAKYQTGLRRCRNFMVQRHGGVTNRSGFRYVNTVAEASSACQLLRYVSEVVGESLLIEQGHDYLRFYRNQALVTIALGDVDAWDVGTAYIIGDLVQAGGVIYYALQDNVGIATTTVATWYPMPGTTFQLPSPFGGVLPHWYQSGRVITFTHKLAPPYELEYVSLTRWVLRPITTVPVIPQVTGLGLVPGGGAGTRTYGYVVTAGMATFYEEGPISAQVIAAGIVAPTPDAPHVLTWTPVPGAVEYYVYSDPYQNGTYAFLGTATGAATFRDVGTTPDFAITPPQPRTLFAAAGTYPHVATDYQQRRMFGQSVNQPDTVWGSRTGFPSNFNISSPLQDDDAIEFRIAGNNNNAVMALRGLKSLVLLTGGGEWTVGQPNVPLTPTTLGADQSTYIGASDVSPVVIGNSVIYLQARGTLVYDLQFNQQVEGLGGRDLTLFAGHLFDGYQIRDLDFQLSPLSVLWCVRSDGTLLGLTYIRDEDVWGWHRHDTINGAFEHVCVVPEAGEDAVYVIVRRTIGAATVRYIERLERRVVLSFNADAFFVDSGLTYSGAAVTTVSGLAHLNGQVVMALADGLVRGPFTVAAGAITLPVAASVVHVGLPITAQIETLDLDVSGSDVRAKKKRVNVVSLLLEQSARVFAVGPDETHLITYTIPPHLTPAAKEFTGLADQTVLAQWGDTGRIVVQQTAPLPLTILSAIPNVDGGG